MSSLWSFNNGVLDLKTNTFTEGTNFSYNSEIDQRKCICLLRILHKTFLSTQVLETFLDQLYLAMTEQVTTGTIIVLYGESNSGKTVIRNLVQALFDNYAILVPRQIFYLNVPYIVGPIRPHTRLLITTGVDENVSKETEIVNQGPNPTSCVNFKLVLKITSGHQEFRDFFHTPFRKKLSVWCFIRNKEMVLDSRFKIVKIPFESRFVEKAEIEDPMTFKADLSLRNDIHHYADALFHMVMDRHH